MVKDKEKIGSKMGKKECYINVYKTGQASPLNLAHAKAESFNMLKFSRMKTLYRIHVRMK